MHLGIHVRQPPRRETSENGPANVPNDASTDEMFSGRQIRPAGSAISEFVQVEIHADQ
jgi:hypothetical protein